MLNLVILGLIIGLPVIILFLLRTSAAVAFFALCSGIVLHKYIGIEARLVLDSTFPNGSIIMSEVLDIMLVTLPLLIIAIKLRKTVNGPKVILNLFPAMTVGLLLALAVVPLISVTTRDNIMATNTWAVLEQMEGFIVGSGVLVSTLMLKGHHNSSEKGHKKHHK